MGHDYWKSTRHEQRFEITNCDIKIPLGPEDNSRRVFTVRLHRVMLDANLAELYGVTTGALKQAIKRNAERFPVDFMFQLSREEAASIRSQIVIL
jgi:hypothetical protein